MTVKDPIKHRFCSIKVPIWSNVAVFKCCTFENRISVPARFLITIISVGYYSFEALECVPELLTELLTVE